MKIDGQRATNDTQATDSAQRAEADKAGRRQGSARPSATGDRVEVSADATLMASALSAANQSPEVRADVVERMREALAAGQVGNDSRKLADALIDTLLK